MRIIHNAMMWLGRGVDGTVNIYTSLVTLNFHSEREANGVFHAILEVYNVARGKS